ncbi:hypothetical protein Cgig2_022055 [Carnegiea gigantea]|uniref:Uncharacterized protein n=1 Tax=Carnegiea gigantea TaxID=171969 RepID=A0A9Q1KTM4_9CARY|nr:hypothetical protein Cgig2_022055 [Carnegiea gigantea]
MLLMVSSSPPIMEITKARVSSSISSSSSSSSRSISAVVAKQSQSESLLSGIRRQLEFGTVPIIVLLEWIKRFVIAESLHSRTRRELEFERVPINVVFGMEEEAKLIRAKASYDSGDEQCNVLKAATQVKEDGRRTSVILRDVILHPLILMIVMMIMIIMDTELRDCLLKKLKRLLSMMMSSIGVSDEVGIGGVRRGNVVVFNLINLCNEVAATSIFVHW